MFFNFEQFPTLVPVSDEPFRHFSNGRENGYVIFRRVKQKIVPIAWCLSDWNMCIAKAKTMLAEYLSTRPDHPLHKYLFDRNYSFITESKINTLEGPWWDWDQTLFADGYRIVDFDEYIRLETAQHLKNIGHSKKYR